MPLRKYILEKGGQPRLEVEWRGLWRDVSVRFDGQEIGTFADKAALKQGRTFTLPDQSNLLVQLVGKSEAAQLLVNRDNVPLSEFSAARNPAHIALVIFGVVLMLSGGGYQYGFDAGVISFDLVPAFAFDGLAGAGLGGVLSLVGLWLTQQRKP
jgi:hypothetical protein